MGRPACTEPQALYKGALYLFTFMSTLALHQVTAAHFSLRRNGQQKTNAADDYTQSSVTCVTRMMFWRCSVGSKRTWVV